MYLECYFVEIKTKFYVDYKIKLLFFYKSCNFFVKIFIFAFIISWKKTLYAYLKIKITL